MKSGDNWGPSGRGSGAQRAKVKCGRSAERQCQNSGERGVLYFLLEPERGALGGAKKLLSAEQLGKIWLERRALRGNLTKSGALICNELCCTGYRELQLEEQTMSIQRTSHRVSSNRATTRKGVQYKILL